MKYPSLLRPVIGCLIFVLALPLASAQQLGAGGGLDSFSLGGMSSQNQKPQSLDKIVAVVNNDVILKSELDAAVAQVKQQNAAQIGQMPRNVLRSQVLDQLIMRQLQIQKANQDGIKVSKAELQQGLSRIAQRNNMNLQQFTQAVQQSGMSMSDVRQHVREEIKISKVRQKEVMGKVSVSDQDVDRYLQNQSLRFSRNHQYHLRQIKLDVTTGSDSTSAGVVRDRLTTLRKQITSGKTSFADAARSVSQGPNAANGGDMGWVSGAKLPDSFDSALAGLKPGQVSPVFRGPDGLYLLKLENERGGKNNSSDNHQKKVMVTEAHIRHIILKPNEIRSDARTRKLAQQIRQRLLAGADFAALARKYSDDSSTARQGGDVGWIPLNRLSPDTRRHIENLHKGEISHIFQTHDGYEIIKLIARRQRDETQEAKRNKAREALGRKRAREKGKLWLRKLRDEAYVDIRMPNYQPTPGTPGS
ncbi:peptidylprolyl isomerase [Salinisphaera sp. LB1]|uniref:peptidylprolyl isomerase n=1 Tax=Salinisphaera sp. LB1 TaxID=2183911 RepID=UPI000D708033|nr:peptidylprolyl isomerase [Salinisphaera sp. LB1]AWN16300.1 Survival protein SurA precursor (Peptidyl-prolyl cis-trans isomerase SurA) [Salinisphaera sp. LB1]